MNVGGTTPTIAEYSQQFDRGELSINRTYQRSPDVWPTSARSYLIDSVLLGFPIAKILLRESTDLRTRLTTKEVVDGQQRTMAINDFLHDRFAITFRDSKFFGKRFSSLDEEDQLAFLSYRLSADVFTLATDEDIRQVFRRMNSYTVPLNRQELRHATHQGQFKWFIHGLTTDYTETLTQLDVVRESHISRMGDADFFTNVIAGVVNGIETGSPNKLDKLYKDFDQVFPLESDCEAFIKGAFDLILPYAELVRSSRLAARHMFYSLLLAAGASVVRTDSLEVLLNGEVTSRLNLPDRTEVNLSALAYKAQSVEEGTEGGTQDEEEGEIPDDIEPPPSDPFEEFMEASTAGTNTKRTREIRFVWFSRALRGTIPGTS